ncbi:MAG: STAS domain-containing protein [Ectothiorhodospiraceae bacterium]|nr:STAS domain-containing protein [Ectothiorhodospiraceae bacterium]
MSEARLEPAGDGRWRLAGELSFASVGSLLPDGRELLNGGEVVLDLSGVTRADSAGVALLVEWLRQARAAGVTLRYAGLPPQMRSLIDLSDLDDILPLDA